MSDLKYDDLVSPTHTADEYLKIFKDKQEVIRNFESYKPKSEVLEQIINLLQKKNQKLKVVALGADWCPDCSRNVPRMIKIIKTLESPVANLQILYGIMVNALHKPGEAIWHKKRSPPEAIDSKFDLTKIPTFYFFEENGDLLGIIVENPKWTSTLEEDLLEILKNKL
ncbi:MAG: thioredoxin family protein [Promethearchaeota archaeon]|jgi:hypothetical protein